jgi:amino acid transporter
MQASDEARLGKGNLTVVDVVAQSVGFIGPVGSAALFIPVIAGLSATGQGAGVATPLSILLAGLGLLGVAWIISRFAKRVRGAGGLYDYVADGFGEGAGFLAGWVYYGGAALLSVGASLAFGGFLSLTLSTTVSIDISWWVGAIGIWVVAFVVGYLGVQISTRLQLTLALTSMAVVFLFVLWIIVQGGSNGNSIKAFNPAEPGVSGVFYGMLYAVIMFVGFESSANLAEETADPRRSVPRAIFGSMIIVIAFYVLTAYALIAAFGFDMGQFLDGANFPPLYAAAANPDFGGHFFGELIQWVVVVDLVAILLGIATSTSRGIFAMARNGRLPRVLAHVHPKHKTPDVATGVLAVAAVILVIVVNVTDGLVLNNPQTDPGPWFGAFQWAAAFAALCFVLVYIAVSLTGFRGLPGENQAGLSVAATVGCAVSLAAIYGIVKDAPSLYALNKVWWEVALWAVVGALLTAWYASRGAFRGGAADAPERSVVG